MFCIAHKISSIPHRKRISIDGNSNAHLELEMHLEVNCKAKNNGSILRLIAEEMNEVY